MHYEYLLWVAVMVNSIHLMEEVYLNAQDFQASVGIPKLSDGEFYFGNAMYLLFGVAAAMIGWRAPAIALTYPLWLMSHVVWFHALMSIKYRSFSPGLLTGVVFNLPVGIACFWGAEQDGVLNWSVVLLALFLTTIYTLVQLALIPMKKMLKGKR